ncbi:MAG: hypothetical protein P4L43_09555 [Syntrophobacteraceae bacterium]|nr:hypothetical protein [Syntrophobacteraceae bacterium]
MGKKKAVCAATAIQCFVNTGSGLAPLDSGSEKQSISSQELPGGSGLTYGQYLHAVTDILCDNSFTVLKELLEKQPKPVGKLETATSIDLIAEKHGALYSVSRLVLRFPDDTIEFAVNCAFSPEQQAFLQVETGLLGDLGKKFDLPYLPLPFISAKAPGISLFIAQWFKNHHEFHLSAQDCGTPPAIKIWKDFGKAQTLIAAQVPELYAQASKILTSYLDPDSFSQIYPWHNAAGDFIIDDSQSPVSLKLITARGYRPLLSRQADSMDKMVGSLHFFVNLCLRLRLDRLDGVGEPAWAGPNCLPGILRGFRQAWETLRKDTNLPKVEEIFSLFHALSPVERLAFAEAVASDGMVEADESDFLSARLPGCMDELADALKVYNF